MNIVLTGFMASGKTTVGRCIAKLSDYKFIDTDEMIVENEGRSINEIFASDGEEYFRDAEYKAVCDASGMDNMVIATGGGVVLNKRNMDKLRENGVIFNLNPDISVIESRIGAAEGTRPLMQGQSLADIKRRFLERKPLYDDCDYQIPVDIFTKAKETAHTIVYMMKRHLLK